MEECTYYKSIDDKYYMTFNSIKNNKHWYWKQNLEFNKKQTMNKVLYFLYLCEENVRNIQNINNNKYVIPEYDDFAETNQDDQTCCFWISDWIETRNMFPSCYYYSLESWSWTIRNWLEYISERAGNNNSWANNYIGILVIFLKVWT